MPNFAFPKNVLFGCTKNKNSYGRYVRLIFANFGHPVSCFCKKQLPRNKTISKFRQKCRNKPKKLKVGGSPWPNFKFGWALCRFFEAQKSNFRLEFFDFEILTGFYLILES